MVYSTAEINAALLAGSRRWSFRHEIIAPDGSLKGIASVTDAKISNNDLADKIKRTGDFSISADSNINYFVDRLRSFAKLRMLDGGYNEWAVGTFHLTTQGAKWNNNRETIRDVEAFDSLIVLVEDAVLTRYVVTAGTNYRTAIATVLASAGFVTNLIASTDEVLPADREWPPGTPKNEIINTLLSAINYVPLKMNAYGVPTSAVYQTPFSAPPIWTYAVDRNSVIVPGIDIGLDLFAIPNAWVAMVSEPDRPVLISSLVNSDPNSILSTVSRGRTVVQIVQQDTGVADAEGNVEAATQAILDAKVLRVSQEASQQYQIAEFSTGLMPFHDSGDVALLNYGEGDLRFREHEWSMDLKAGGKMSHKFRRVVLL